MRCSAASLFSRLARSAQPYVPSYSSNRRRQTRQKKWLQGDRTGSNIVSRQMQQVMRFSIESVRSSLGVAEKACCDGEWDMFTELQCANCILLIFFHPERFQWKIYCSHLILLHVETVSKHRQQINDIKTKIKLFRDNHKATVNDAQREVWLFHSINPSLPSPYPSLCYVSFCFFLSCPSPVSARSLCLSVAHRHLLPLLHPALFAVQDNTVRRERTRYNKAGEIEGVKRNDLDGMEITGSLIHTPHRHPRRHARSQPCYCAPASMCPKQTMAWSWQSDAHRLLQLHGARATQTTSPEPLRCPLSETRVEEGPSRKSCQQRETKKEQKRGREGKRERER